MTSRAVSQWLARKLGLVTADYATPILKDRRTALQKKVTMLSVYYTHTHLDKPVRYVVSEAAAMESIRRSAQADGDSGWFGVRVRVQGVSGRPCVVLNTQRNPDSPDYPDVFPMEPWQQECVSRSVWQQECVSSMSGGASSTQTPPDNSRSLRSFRHPWAQQNQRNPETPRWSSSPNSPVVVKRARIPVPGAGFLGPVVESVPCRPSHIISRVCVPQEQNPSGSPRPGRARHHSRTTPEEKRRSRSLETRSTRSGTPAAVVTGVSSTSAGVTEVTGVSSTSAGVTGVTEVTGVSSTSAGVTGVTEVTGVGSTSTWSEVKEEMERTAQATPDLLKGQRELPDHPNEETVKLLMVNYLREGSSEDEAVIRRKVELMFDQINMLKFRALEEFEFADPLEQVKDLRDRRAALESHVCHLQQQLQETLQNRQSLIEEKEERAAELERLQEALERSEQEQVTLKHKLTDMEKELQTSLDQLLQARRARDQCRSDMRDLQQQLSDIHDELDSAKSCEAGERDGLLQELCVLRGEFQALQLLQEEQEEVLRRRERELTALRGALEEEISAHASDLHTLQEEQQQEVQQLREATGQAKESVALLGRRVLEVAEEKEASQTLISDLTHTKAELLQKTSALEEQISSLNLLIQQKEAQETQLREHSEQLMVEKQHLEEELQEVRQQEEHMCGANQTLTRHLEDTQSELSRVTRAHRELKERRSQERLQEERCVLEEKLSRCEFDLNEAELKAQQLQKRIKELEENRHTHDDRHYKLMEVRVCELERSVMEERSGSDSLMKRLERGREQMEQARAELLQERAARQDLECDRIRLERQNKDLRSRVLQLEGSQRSGTDATISKLQLQVHELEERLLGEEKESGELQQQNRRLERHIKELTLHLEEERLELQDQRDQLALRLRTLKRQLDEAEEEMERLENSKKKLQRDLEEQQEQNEQLHTELCGLRRNNRPNKLQITADDEDDEDENETEATLDAN
ncbi:unnamed protein product [Leuciscus chuanchicus]